MDIICGKPTILNIAEWLIIDPNFHFVVFNLGVENQVAGCTWDGKKPRNFLQISQNIHPVEYSTATTPNYAM